MQSSSRLLRPADRKAIERIAAEVAVPFVGLWLDARRSHPHCACRGASA